MKLLDILYVISGIAPNIQNVSPIVNSLDIESIRSFSVFSKIECDNGLDFGKEEFDIQEDINGFVFMVFTLNGDYEQCDTVDKFIEHTRCFKKL